MRMSWMSVGWATSGASGGLDLPKSCLNTSISAGISTTTEDSLQNGI